VEEIAEAYYTCIPPSTIYDLKSLIGLGYMPNHIRLSRRYPRFTVCRLLHLSLTVIPQLGPLTEVRQVGVITSHVRCHHSACTICVHKSDTTADSQYT
jgi:hypothetical protein